MSLEQYFEKFGAKISQDSERLFVTEFLWPLLGDKLMDVEPQYLFIDSTGRSRRIDFAIHSDREKIAIEINGETYHAEGVVANEVFDDNLFRQNEILRKGYKLLRFSYNQLIDPSWRPIVMASLREHIATYSPNLLCDGAIQPTSIQIEALDALAHCRGIRGWQKGIVVMPTGTGKTILSALDARRIGKRTLFIVHRLDILKQSMDAFRKVWSDAEQGLLTGIERYKEHTCDVLFASKDSLRRVADLEKFPRDWFQYLIIDEVHHGQSPSYGPLLSHFTLTFMLGMTATPDRMDRKDIFELFDYNKVYEISISDVIESGELVPYTYIGLVDNIDYSRIRFQNHRYRVDDLERLLIIPERNHAILDAYVAKDKGAGDKAIGFCVSIEHAERMSKFFIDRGILSASIHSNTPNRDELIRRFRNDEFQIVFTVDLFNEGIDFPNVRVLLFLRPTESRTVFMQQLGRGLRKCSGKDRVRVLDFIGNYSRANQIRKYLSKSSTRDDYFDENGNRKKKILYEYANGCEVVFDATIEELLDRQDASDLGVDKEDLKQSYFALAESLERKPTKKELDESGEHPSRLYVQVWGSWLKFLRDVGEYTEASYHYPQGTHLGHLLAILWYFGLPSREGTQFDDRYVKMRGNLDEGRLGAYQRQLKYKLQAAMELRLIEDDRMMAADDYRQPSLTLLGSSLRASLEGRLAEIDLSFSVENGVPSTRMKNDEDFYDQLLLDAINRDSNIKKTLFEVFLGMHAVQQMMAYIYHIARDSRIEKNRLYNEFFESPFVHRFCEREGIEEATPEASRRRCPFLLHILAACGVVKLERQVIQVEKLLLIPQLVKQFDREEPRIAEQRLESVRMAWPDRTDRISSEDLSVLRELFGANFITSSYTWSKLETSSD
jgi:superfamily II DNA or RNA helicase